MCNPVQDETVQCVCFKIVLIVKQETRNLMVGIELAMSIFIFYISYTAAQTVLSLLIHVSFQIINEKSELTLCSPSNSNFPLNIIALYSSLIPFAFRAIHILQNTTFYTSPCFLNFCKSLNLPHNWR